MRPEPGGSGAHGARKREFVPGDARPGIDTIGFPLHPQPFGDVIAAERTATFDSVTNDFAPLMRAVPSDGSLWIGVSGVGVPSRTFDADSWASIVRAIAPQASAFHVAAQPSDAELARAIVERLPGATLVSGSFATLCARLARAERVITIDGGFAHIAAGLGVPVTAVFTAGVAAKWKPFQKAAWRSSAIRTFPVAPARAGERCRPALTVLPAWSRSRRAGCVLCIRTDSDVQNSAGPGAPPAPRAFQ